jgi:hypothetical protein
MEKVGILSLGVSAAAFAAMYFRAVMPDQALWQTLCAGGLFIGIALHLFFTCKCGEERKQRVVKDKP